MCRMTSLADAAFAGCTTMYWLHSSSRQTTARQLNHPPPAPDAVGRAACPLTLRGRRCGVPPCTMHGTVHPTGLVCANIANTRSPAVPSCHLRAAWPNAPPQLDHSMRKPVNLEEVNRTWSQTTRAPCPLVPLTHVTGSRLAWSRGGGVLTGSTPAWRSSVQRGPACLQADQTLGGMQQPHTFTIFGTNSCRVDGELQPTSF